MVFRNNYLVSEISALFLLMALLGYVLWYVSSCTFSILFYMYKLSTSQIILMQLKITDLCEQQRRIAQPPPPPQYRKGSLYPSLDSLVAVEGTQTARMRRLIWVFAGRTSLIVGFVMRWLKNSNERHWRVQWQSESRTKENHDGPDHRQQEPGTSLPTQIEEGKSLVVPSFEWEASVS